MPMVIKESGTIALFDSIRLQWNVNHENTALPAAIETLTTG